MIQKPKLLRGCLGMEKVLKVRQVRQVFGLTANDALCNANDIRSDLVWAAVHSSM